MSEEGSAKILDGKAISLEVLEEIKRDVDVWTKQGHRAPSLKVILVGDNPASETYIKRKHEAANNVGILTETIKLPDSITQEELLERIEKLNKDENVDGILVQLPVPEHISELAVCNAVDEDKDVDGFHYSNLGKLVLNMKTTVPCTALAVLELIKRSGVKTFGKNALICGRSKHIGLPISLILQSDYRNEFPGLESTTIMCHRNTPPEELMKYAPTADIIISATGVVGLIKPEMVKPGALVIDVGLTKITLPNGNSKLVGDVEYEGVKKVAGYITPVPGGVGPMTVAMLMKNTFNAAIKLAGKIRPRA